MAHSRARAGALPSKLGPQEHVGHGVRKGGRVGGVDDAGEELGTLDALGADGGGHDGDAVEECLDRLELHAGPLQEGCDRHVCAGQRDRQVRDEPLRGDAGRASTSAASLVETSRPTASAVRPGPRPAHGARRRAAANARRPR